MNESEVKCEVDFILLDLINKDVDALTSRKRIMQLFERGGEKASSDVGQTRCPKCKSHSIWREIMTDNLWCSECKWEGTGQRSEERAERLANAKDQ